MGVSAGFVRLMTRPNFLSCPATPTEAVDYVREWFRFPPPIPVNLGSSHLTYFRQKLVAAGVGANMVTDAQIAALAMEYQAEVHSNDTDFGRFSGPMVVQSPPIENHCPCWPVTPDLQSKPTWRIRLKSGT